MNHFFCVCCLLVAVAVGAQSPDNSLPMYGRVKKNKELQALDQKFISTETQHYGSRKTASQHYLDLGWRYLANGDKTTAIKRFNQAWLLDSTNMGTYWGFGAVLSQRGHYDDALFYMGKFRAYNPKSSRILVDMATVHLQKAHFERTTGNLPNSRKSFEEAELLLRKSLHMEPRNGYALYQLGALYFDTKRMDSSRVYLQKAYDLDSLLVNKKLKDQLGIH